MTESSWVATVRVADIAGTEMTGKLWYSRAVTKKSLLGIAR